MKVSSNKLFSISVVGAFDLLDCEGRSVRPTGRKDCALIAMLALTSNHRQTRTWLQDKLWGDRGPAQAAASLRQSLTTLRSILNNTGDVICADRTWVWLEPNKLNFDHLSADEYGEILRGFDLREEGFNDWLRETRSSYNSSMIQGEVGSYTKQHDRIWYFDIVSTQSNDENSREIDGLICDSLVEALSVIGVHAIIDRRGSYESLPPRATDLIVRIRTVRFGAGCIIGLSVTDGFGSLLWQIRREADITLWSKLKALQIEIAQLFQDFAIQTEAESLRGDHWNARANGCQALMGILLPGSVPAHEIAQCCELAIAADEKGIYHALLGDAHLLLYGEREPLVATDADEIMQRYKNALRLSPGNGLVQALAGHSYGFFMNELDRNIEMTKEAVRLLPNSGTCWTYYSISLTYAGHFEKAVHAATRAVWLSRGTIAESMAQSAELFSRLMFGDVQGAIRAGEIALDAGPFRPTILDLMTAYTLEGRIQDGLEKLELLLRREPELSIDMLSSPEYPIVNPIHRSAVIESASKLGLN